MVDPDEQLAVREPDRIADPYEREYMRGAGTVLYRDKTRSWQVHAVFGAVMVWLVVTAALAEGGLLAGLVGVPLMVLVWLLFSVLRVTVSERAVNVQLGLFGPKIPVDAIESVEARDYDWKTFGGWGIRLNSRGEWMYNLPGDGGRAVKIVWRAPNGRRKVTWVASRAAERVATTIEQARAALPAAPEPSAALPPGEPPRT